MNQLCIVTVGAMAALTLATAQQTAPKKEAQKAAQSSARKLPANPFVGRWDLTVTTPAGEQYPQWMSVSVSDCCLTAYVQPRTGSALAATDVKRDGQHLTFNLKDMSNAQDTAKLRDTVWDVTASGANLNGTIKREAAVDGTFVAVRSPDLKRAARRVWGNPEPLFNGKDLTGWEPIAPAENHWVAKDGELVNEQKGSNLKTARKFGDFKLHIEFNCPDKGNSGIYLRGRYEVQVEYEPLDANDRFHRIGSIYSFLAPAVDVPRTPGKWESFDITLEGRYVLVIRSGAVTIDYKEIPGITGGALDSRESEPGPILLQGDHTGGVKFRNITISLPK